MQNLAMTSSKTLLKRLAMTIKSKAIWRIIELAQSIVVQILLVNNYCLSPSIDTRFPMPSDFNAGNLYFNDFSVGESSESNAKDIDSSESNVGDSRQNNDDSPTNKTDLCPKHDKSKADS